MKLRAAADDRPTDALAVAIPSDRIGWQMVAWRPAAADVPAGLPRRPGVQGRAGAVRAGAGARRAGGAARRRRTVVALGAGGLRSAAAVAARAAGRQSTLAVAFGRSDAGGGDGHRRGRRARGLQGTPGTGRSRRRTRASARCGWSIPTARRPRRSRRRWRPGPGGPGGAPTSCATWSTSPAACSPRLSSGCGPRRWRAANGVECTVHDEKAIKRLGLGRPARP